jgi:hypothetical protein
MWMSDMAVPTVSELTHIQRFMTSPVMEQVADDFTERVLYGEPRTAPFLSPAIDEITASIDLESLIEFFRTQGVEIVVAIEPEEEDDEP